MSAAVRSLETCLAAGVRWLYATTQPAGALVDPRGARLIADGCVVRFVPIGVSGLPLIVVDLLDRSCGSATALNALPASGVSVIADELDQLGMAATAQRYHAITGTVAFDIAAGRSLRAAVARLKRGCPNHHLQPCNTDPGGQVCAWRSAGHKAAIWPNPIRGAAAPVRSAS